MSIKELMSNIDKKNSPIVVGLDTRIEFVPKRLLTYSIEQFGKNVHAIVRAIVQYNKELIDCFCDLVPCVKPQSAYYEIYGETGMMALRETISYARSKGLYVILDVKRNDIGETAKAYAQAYLGKTKIIDEDIRPMEADGVTINPYFGDDGILPFIEEMKTHKKTAFCLVKTSNKSSGQIQDLICEDGRPVYMHVAGKVNEWAQEAMPNGMKCGDGRYSSFGAVVGATYPEQAKILRDEMPGVFFLVPGYGAQGAQASDVVHCFDEDGRGAIVNASRSIICAHMRTESEEGYDFKAREQVLLMHKQIIEALEEKVK